MDFLGKVRVFQFESLFRVSSLLYRSSLDFYIKFIISASWIVVPVQILPSGQSELVDQAKQAYSPLGVLWNKKAETIVKLRKNMLKLWNIYNIFPSINDCVTYKSLNSVIGNEKEDKKYDRNKKLYE